jgi:hypothetical protein
MKRLLNKLLFKFRLDRAIKEAKKWHDINGSAYLVIMWKGKPLCISKRRLKQMIATRKFVKGTTIQEIESKAFFKT